MALPNFFVLGAAKCGTTSLQYYLAQHPSVAVARPEETRFFDAFFEKGMEFYSSEFFSHCKGETAVGEATPHYLFLPFVADRLLAFDATARLVVILRNPVDRAFSHWWMERSSGREALGFDESMRRSMAEMQDRGLLEGEQGEAYWRGFMNDYLTLGKVTRRMGYAGQGLYAKQIMHYHGRFGPAQMKILFLEDLAADPQGVVSEVWDFLGVDPDCTIADANIVNVAMGPLAKRVRRTAGALGFHTWLPRRMRHRAARWLSRIERPPKMPTETRAWLSEYYAPDIQSLSSLTGRDLGHWHHNG